MLGPITTKFVFEQIIDPNVFHYRGKSLFTDHRGIPPNWLIYFTMQDCQYCDMLMPVGHSLARTFHAPTSYKNYIVAYVDCSR